MKLKENPLVTDLVGEKTTKLDNRVVFFGECDELSCHIMEIRCMIDDEQIKETNSSNINADFSAWSFLLGLENEEIDTREFCDYREHYENIYFSNYYFYDNGKYYFVSDMFVEDAIKFILDDDLDGFCEWLLENYNEEISYWLEDDE